MSPRRPLCARVCAWQQGEILALLLADPDLELSLTEILLAHLLAYIPGIATAYTATTQRCASVLYHRARQPLGPAGEPRQPTRAAPRNPGRS
jgi:hypothetical protein